MHHPFIATKQSLFVPQFIVLQLTIVLLLFSSCNATKLFQDYSTTNTIEATQDSLFSPNFELLLKPDDKITISVWGHPELSIGSIYTNQSGIEDNGRWLLIDKVGEANLPELGKVKLGGLNEREASLYLETLYGKFIKKPVVDLKVLNREVTVLGEVNSPGNFALEENEVRLIEIIGRAGGFATYANVENVQVIRNSNSSTEKVVLTYDLSDLNTLSKANLVLRPDDIVYVQAKKGKEFVQFGGEASIFVGIVTSIALLISVVSR